MLEKEEEGLLLKSIVLSRSVKGFKKDCVRSGEREGMGTSENYGLKGRATSDNSSLRC